MPVLIGVLHHYMENMLKTFKQIKNLLFLLFSATKRWQISLSLNFLLFLSLLFLLPSSVHSDSWPMAMRDPAHSGRSSDVINLPFTLKVKTRISLSSSTVGLPTYPVYDNNVIGMNNVVNGTTIQGVAGAANIETGKILWSIVAMNPLAGLTDFYPAIYMGKYMPMANSGDLAGINSLDILSGQYRDRRGGNCNISFNRGIGETYHNNFVFAVLSTVGSPRYTLSCSSVNEAGQYNSVWGRDTIYDSSQDYRIVDNNTGSSIPCIGNGILYVQFGGEIHAINMLTGWSFWKTGNGKFKKSVAYENGKLYCAGSDYMYCLDANNKGAELWKYPVAYANSPIVNNGTVFFRGDMIGTSEHPEYSNFYALDANSPTLKWKFTATGRGYPAVANSNMGDIVYFGAGSQLYGCKVNTSNPNGEVVWQASIPNSNTNFGTVIIGDNKLIATGDGSYIYVYGENTTGNASLIQKPRIGAPVIVKDGDNFSIECKGEPSVGGVWSARLIRYNNIANLTIISKVYDPLTCLWKLTAQVPAGTNECLYDLEVTNSQAVNISANSVKVIKEIRSNYYYIQISSPLNNFGTLIDQFTLINPEFVVITGDTVNSGSSYEYDLLLNSLSMMEIPVFIVPGEIQCYGESNSESHKVYEKYVGPRYYSFNYGTHKYVGIDTTDSNSSIGNTQMEWLDSELSANAGMKTVFYSKDRSNQLPAICDRYGVNCALSYDAETPSNGVSILGLMPTIYIKTDKTSRLYYSTAFNGFRVVKVNNNKTVSYLVEPAWGAVGTGTGKIYAEYKLKDDGSAGNDGILKGNIAKTTNYHSSSFDNLRVKFLMPASSSYISNNEVISKIDRGDGISICKVKAAVGGGISRDIPAKSDDICIADNSIPTSIVTWYKDSSFVKELPRIYVTTGEIITRLSLGVGRYYFKVFTTDGRVPCVTQQGGSNIVIGNVVPSDGSGLYYKGYFDSDAGDNCDARIFVNGFLPELGNTVRFLRIPGNAPVFYYCTYTGGTSITIEGRRRDVWTAKNGPVDFYYGTTINEDAGIFYSYGTSKFHIYRSVGSNDWTLVKELIGDLKWTDTNTVQGTTYKYRITTVGRTEVESSFSREFVVTAGAPIITGLTCVTVTSSSAVITWTTDLPSTSQVEYTIPAAEGIGYLFDSPVLLPENPALVTTHIVTITGLKPFGSGHGGYGVRAISRSGDGKVNSFGYEPATFYMFGGTIAPGFARESFKTFANAGTTIFGLKGEFESKTVLPGDKNNIIISALDSNGNILQITPYTTITLKVLTGGGVFSDNSTQLNFTMYSGILNIKDLFTTGSVAGINSIEASSSGVTPITVNLLTAYPDHYKVEVPAEITAGENFAVKMTAYSNASESVILPVTITDKKLSITAVKGDNSPADSLWSDSVNMLKDGIGLTAGIYNKVESTGIKIKVEDTGGKTGVSSIINIKANENKKWKVAGELNKPVAAIGDNITITGRILDVYENVIRTSGTLVTFSKLSGSGSLISITAVTDANGAAVSTITVTDNIINVVELSSGSLEKSKVYIKTNSVSFLNLTSSSSVLKVAELASITVETKDSGLNPIGGVEIDLTIVTGGGSLSADKVITDVNGQFVIQYLGSELTQINTVRGQAAGTNIIKEINITTVTGDLHHYKIESSVTGAKAGENFTITITTRDKCDNFINTINKGVNLSAVLNGYTVSYGLGVLSVVTASLTNGTTSIINENYTRMESIQIKVTDNNGITNYSPRINITNNTVSTISSVFRVGTGDVTRAARNKSVTLLLNIKDAYDNPVNGAVVTLSADKGSFVGATKVTSDTNGRAVGTYKTGEGICTVTMTSGGVQGQAAVEGLVPSQIITNPASPIVSMSSPDSFIITVKNSSGDAVPCATVAFTVISGTVNFWKYNAQNSQVLLPSPQDTDYQGNLRIDYKDINTAIDNIVKLTCDTSTSNLTIRYSALVSFFGSTDGLVGSVKALSFRLTRNNFALSGATIIFNVESGGGGLSSVSAVTDGNGIAGTNLTLGPNQGNNVVSATFAGLALTTATIKGIKIGSVSVSGDSPVAKGGTGSIKAIVYDTTGASLTFAGTPVSFSKISGVGSVASIGSTNSSGEAVVTFTAGNTQGSSVISATAVGVSGQTTIQVADVSIIEASATPAIILTNIGQSNITALAKDSNGYTVKSANISFGLVSGTGIFTLITGTTDNSGIVKTTYKNTTKLGDNIISITSGSATTNLTITGIAGMGDLSGSKLKLTAPPSMNYINPTPTTISYSATKKDIFAQILNSLGEPVGVGGATVTLKATGGLFYYYSQGVKSTNTITTVADIYGKADLTGAGLSSLNFYPIAGNNTITASAVGCSPATVTIICISADSGMLDLRAEPSSIKPSGSVKITAKITSGLFPLAGTSVIFSFTSTGGGSLSLISGLTNDKGEVSSDLFATSSPTMTYMINAANIAYNLSATLGIPTASATVESFGVEAPSNIVINQGFNLKIKALDINGYFPIITAPVIVTISAVLASDGVTPATGSLNTTIATITNNIDSSVSLTNLTYTAAEDIMIKVTGAGKSSLSPLISITKSANSIELTAIPNGSIAGQSVMVSGKIKDIDGKGVCNKAINLSATTGSLNVTTGISDNEGKFSAMLTTPAGAATITVTATCSTIVGVVNVTTTGVVASYIVVVPTAGDRNGFAVSITAKDSLGNTVKCGSMVNLTVVTGTGTLGITTVRLTDGVATITETYSKVENGVKIKATDGNNKTGTSGIVNLSDSMPRVVNITPNTVSNSASVTLTITGLNYYGGGNSSVVSSVKIKESSETVLSGWSCVSDSVINSAVVISKTKPGTYDVIITTTLGGSNAVSDMKLLVTAAAPTITTLSGSSAEYGKAVTISVTGSGFFGGTDSSNLTGIRITSNPVTNITTGYTVVSDSSITNVIIPSSINVGSYSLIVKTGGGDSGGKAFTITAALPAVTNVIPSSGYKHLTNTISLAGTGFFGGVGSNNVTQIKLNGTTIVTINPGYSVVSDTVINNIVVNAGITAGTYDVLVTTAGGTNSTSTVRYEATELAPTPVISTVTPASVEYNNAVTLAISGNGFYGSTASNKVTGIRITTSPVTNIIGYSVVSDSSIINIPVIAGIAIGSYNIIVTTIGGDSLEKAFTVTSPVPTVTTVTPSSGYNYINNTISITGTGFFGGLGSNNVSQIKLNGATTVTIPAGYSVVSDTVINNIVVNSGISAGSYDLQVTNGGGASTSTVKYTVIADTTAPTVVTAVANTTLINITFSEDVSAATATNKGNYFLESPTGTGARNLSSATISYTNKVVSIGSLSLTSGNTFTVTVTNVQDAAGNTIVNNGSTNKASGTVAAGDITPPTGSININNSAVYISTNLVTLILSASDASGVTQMRFSDDGSSFGSAEAYTGTRAYTLQAGDGIKTVYVQYKDTPGNWSSALISDTITLDTTGPVGTVNINNSAVYTQTTTVTLQLTSADVFSGVSKMQFSNNGTDWSAEENIAASKVWTLDTAEGVKTVYVRYKDVVGNLSLVTISHTISLDATAPEGAVIINGGAAYTNSQAGYLELTASDASGVAEMRFSRNGTNWTTVETYSTSKSYNLSLGDGVKIVYVQYKDNAGNWSSTEMSSTIILDTTAPAGTIAINNGVTFTKSTTVTLSMNANDDLSGISKMDFSNNGSTWNGEEDYVVNKVWSLDSVDGNKAVYAKYKDNAGNTATVTSTIKLVSAKYLKVEGPVNVIAGTSLNITIKAMKQDNTTATGYLDLIGLSSTDTSSTFISNYTFTSSDSGVNVMNVVFKSVGTQTIEVNDNEVAGIIKGSIEVKVYAGSVISAISGGSIETADGTCVSIPNGALESNVTIGFGVTENPNDVNLGYKFRNTNTPISRDFGALDMLSNPWRFKNITFKQPVTIWIPYKKSEIGNIEEKSLRIFGYNETTGKYEVVEGNQVMENGRIKAQVNHFSTYRILGTYVSSNLNNVIAYPNPYRPGTAVDGKLKIINLPIDCTATIYNIAGEKIREIKESDLGNLGWIDWDGKNDSSEPVARGVYLYVIIASDGSKKIGKFGMIK